MAYRRHKETPQSRIKTKEPNGQADISAETLGGTVLWNGNSSQVWAVRTASFHPLKLDRKPLGMGNTGEHHHTRTHTPTEAEKSGKIGGR